MVDEYILTIACNLIHKLIHDRCNWSFIEGLHDAIRTYTRMILQSRLVSFCTAKYGEKQ